MKVNAAVAEENVIEADPVAAVPVLFVPNNRLAAVEELQMAIVVTYLCLSTRSLPTNAKSVSPL